jgi:hypothetical protein
MTDPVDHLFWGAILISAPAAAVTISLTEYGRRWTEWPVC